MTLGPGTGLGFCLETAAGMVVLAYLSLPRDCFAVWTVTPTATTDEAAVTVGGCGGGGLRLNPP